MSDGGAKTRFFDDEFVRKMLLAIFDKLLLGGLVILLLTPVQNQMAAVQKRHDKATQINDFVVDNAVRILDDLNKELAEWAAVVRTKVRTGSDDIEPLVRAQARVEAKVAALSAYLDVPAVTNEAKGVKEHLVLVSGFAGSKHLTRENVDTNITEAYTRAAKLSKAAINECQRRINDNVEKAYAPPPTEKPAR